MSALAPTRIGPPSAPPRRRRPGSPPLAVVEPPASPWLEWARRLDAMARIGAAFAVDPHEVRRYAELGTMAKEMFAELHACPVVEVPELYAPTEGYVTPKVDVRAAIFDEAGRVLLVHEVAADRWCLPGGWADVGDSPARAAVREVREESGFEVEVTKLVGVFDGHNPRSTFSAYQVVFAGRVVSGRADGMAGGVPGGDGETDAVGFFPSDRIPLLCGHRTRARVLAEAFAHAADPDRPALFE